MVDINLLKCAYGIKFSQSECFFGKQHTHAAGNSKKQQQNVETHNVGNPTCTTNVHLATEIYSMCVLESSLFCSEEDDEIVIINL